MKPLILLSADEVAARLSMEGCIDAVEKAFAAHTRGQSLAPALLHVDADGGEFHVKAGGLLGGRGVFACKINGAFPHNRERGLPTIVGLIVLSDATSGEPLAVLDSGLITRMRTGAATAVAAKYLARAESDTATICGAGAQAAFQIQALQRVLPLQRAFLWSRSSREDSARRLSAEVGIEVTAAPDLHTATRQSQVIVTCTPATSWYLGRADVAPGTFIAAVGADSPHKQELEPALVGSAVVVCDLTSQCAKVGELHHAIEAEILDASAVRGELGEVILGNKPGRTNAEEVIVFDSTGTALQDAAAAAAVLSGDQA